MEKLKQSSHKHFDIFIMLFLGAIAFCLQLYFLNPPILSDQLEYYQTAVEFPRLPENPNIGSMRIGLILPVAVLYRILGYSEAAYYAVPFLSMIVLSLSVYQIGKMVFSTRVGFFSALAILFIPNLVQEYGHLLPDIPSTACVSAAFAVLFGGIQRVNKKNDLSDKGNHWRFFLAGLLFGWSYLIKEYLAILFFLIPVVFYLKKLSWRNLVPIIAGMLLMYGVEAGVGLAYYQNPLIRFIAATPRETVGEIHKDIGKIVSFLFILLMKDGGAGYLVIMVVGFVDSVIQSLKGKPNAMFLLGWVLLIYLLFTAAGLLPVLFKWEDIVLMRLHKFRYWIPILPPLIIGGVAALERIFIWLARQWGVKDRILTNLSMACIILAAGAVGYVRIKDDPNFIRNGQGHYLELRRYLQNENSACQERIWIDRDNRRAFARILPMYVRDSFGQLYWPGEFKYINTNGLYLKAEEITDGCLIVDRIFMPAGSSSMPGFLSAPPEDWELTFESENERIALYNIQS